MRNFTYKPIEEMEIDKMELESDSRDDIPQLIKGLHYIFVTPLLRQEVFAILTDIFPPELDLDNGRPGMDRWSILVMGVLRLGLNCDYDRLHNLVNNHRTIRQMLGHGDIDDGKYYSVQTLKDNVVLFTPEILDRVNQAVVKAGHKLIREDQQENNQRLAAVTPVKDKLKGRCDSFVVETNVEYPTDTRLLFDALRKAIELLMLVCKMVGLLDWQTGQDQIRELKKILRQLQRLKPSSAKDEAKRAQRQQAIVEAHRAYLREASRLLQQVEKTWQKLWQHQLESRSKLLKIEEFINHARRQINQIERRVIQGETIPHQEKVFSIFEPHTEWLSKGKAGVPVELGVAANSCLQQ